jgi:hypothetical protein
MMIVYKKALPHLSAAFLADFPVFSWKSTQA